MRRPAHPPLWPIILLVTLTQPAESQRVEDSPAESPRLTLLKRELEQADRPALDQFWAERKDHVPLVEPLHNQNGFLLVTFVWRDTSAPSSILLHGGPPSQLPKTLRRLAGTDLWFRTELIPTDARFTYGFEVRTNLDSAIEPRVMPDPLRGRYHATLRKTGLIRQNGFFRLIAVRSEQVTDTLRK